MMDYEKEIVRREIKRLKKSYDEAHDRYAYGSRSAGNTMDKCNVLIEILEKALDEGSEEE